jgi:hypothetical protein
MVAQPVWREQEAPEVSAETQTTRLAARAVAAAAQVKCVSRRSAWPTVWLSVVAVAAAAARHLAALPAVTAVAVATVVAPLVAMPLPEPMQLTARLQAAPEATAE